MIYIILIEPPHGNEAVEMGWDPKDYVVNCLGELVGPFDDDAAAMLWIDQFQEYNVGTYQFHITGTSDPATILQNLRKQEKAS
jgi:hypothetical protein